jgi:hypothetical protein
MMIMVSSIPEMIDMIKHTPLIKFRTVLRTNTGAGMQADVVYATGADTVMEAA